MTKKSTAAALSTSALALLSLGGFFFFGGVGKMCGRALVEAVVGGPGTKLPNHWEPGFLTPFTTGVFDDSVCTDNISRNYRQEFNDCFVELAQERYPGGPQQMANRGIEESNRRGYQIGVDCHQRIVPKMRKEEVWFALFPPLFAKSCASNNGAAFNAWCECVSKEAQRLFSGPKSFLKVYGNNDPEKLNRRERKRLNALVLKCLDLHPESPRAPP